LGFVVLCLTAGAAAAQVTLNLDVLTEDFVPKEAVTSKPDEKKTEKKTGKKAVPAKPAAKKQTAKPGKPAVQKPAAPKKPKKPTPMKKVVAKTKYQVRENAEQDEHDRLKPRAKPVPEVKIIAFEEKKAAKEKAEAEKAKAAQEEVIVLKEPPLSKLFLEQERQKKEEAEKKAKAEAEEKKAAEKAAPVPARKKPKPVPAPKTLLSRDAVRKDREIEEARKVAAAAEAKKKHSVIRAAGNLTPQERSLELLKKVPEDSATTHAVARGRRLSRIFVYEDTSAELTPDMQESLDQLAAALKKAPGKRVVLYTYASPSEPDYGRERQISLRRALMIRSYLSRAGVRSLRVEIRSQGEKGAGTDLPDRADILIYER
jgi:outer membrane protein OmpA-like peptidoglycan-associated protein